MVYFRTRDETGDLIWKNRRGEGLSLAYQFPEWSVHSQGEPSEIGGWDKTMKERNQEEKICGIHYK